MADNKLKFIVEVDTKKGQAELKGFAKKYGANVKQMKAGTAQLGGGVKNLGGVMKTVFAGAAAAAVISFGKKAVASYIEQEDAENRLAAALKNVNEYSDAQFEHLKKNASQFQENSRYGDEYIMDMQALGLRLGIQTKDLEKATQAAMDMAAATGKDLKTSFELLGKAAKGETGTLSRYGIILDKNIPKAEKFEEAMRLMNKQFGGAAQADTDTLGGQLAQLKNTFGDLMETVGEQLMPAMKFWAGELKLLTEAIDFFAAGKSDEDTFGAGESVERQKTLIKIVDMYASGKISDETKKIKLFSQGFSDADTHRAMALNEQWQAVRRIYEENEGNVSINKILSTLIKNTSQYIVASAENTEKMAAAAAKAAEEAARLAKSEADRVEYAKRMAFYSEYQKELDKESLQLYEDRLATAIRIAERGVSGGLALIDQEALEDLKALNSEMVVFGYALEQAKAGTLEMGLEKLFSPEEWEIILAALDDFNLKLEKTSATLSFIGNEITDSLTQGILTGEMNFKASVDRMKEYFLSQLIQAGVMKLLELLTGGGTSLIPTGNIFSKLFNPTKVGDLIITSRGETFQTAPDDNIYASKNPLVPTPGQGRTAQVIDPDTGYIVPSLPRPGDDTRAQPLTVVINVGTVVGNSGMEEFTRIINDGIENQRGSRNG